jgi:GNAT superfamily N-acetyltransferase
MTGSETLRSLAEDAAAYLPEGPGSRRIVDERYVVEIGAEPSPGHNVVSRLRLGENVDETVRDVRRLYLDAGRDTCTWEVSTASTPDGLGERLLAVGMTPDDPPTMLALACTTEPGSPTVGVMVEQVHTDEQFDEVRRVLEDEDEDDGWSPSDEWLRGPPSVTRYLARIDGEAVATADITWLDHPDAIFLGGARTVPRARRRGAYRALVHARWQAAHDAGRSVLVTQSEPMSQPILARLGFEPVGKIDVYVDRFAP